MSFRDLWGKEKRAQLLDEAAKNLAPEYAELHPALNSDCRFGRRSWLAVTCPGHCCQNCFRSHFRGYRQAGMKLSSTSIGSLIDRMKQYFDPDLSDADVRGIVPKAMIDTARFSAKETRRYLVKRGFKPEKIVECCYRPFDSRWLYWESETKLLDEKRSEYIPHVLEETFGWRPFSRTAIIFIGPSLPAILVAAM